MPGTVAAYQPRASKCALATSAPACGTLATSCSIQPAASVTGCGAEAAAAGEGENAAESKPKQKGKGRRNDCGSSTENSLSFGSRSTGCVGTRIPVSQIGRHSAGPPSIRNNGNMEFQRSSGVLLHISSLPSYGGIGDLGPAAHEFVAFLARAKQHIWQVLPLCPTGYGNSPYAGSSAFAGNPALISLEFLRDWGWIGADRIAGLARQFRASRF